MNSQIIILSTAYFGPIQYFTKFTGRQTILIEQYDNYIKQTYRNRCIISSSNGPLPLTVPVKRIKGRKTLLKDIRIDYDTNWRKIHNHGIISSYNSSPFFEYLRDDIEPFFTKNYKFLIDLNMDITKKIIELLELNPCFSLSSEYIFQNENAKIIDFRDIIHPKREMKEDPAFISKPYQQVYSTKFGFIPNLSILDLLFNTGNEAKIILRSCITTN